MMTMLMIMMMMMLTGQDMTLCVARSYSHNRWNSKLCNNVDEQQFEFSLVGKVVLE